VVRSQILPGGAGEINFPHASFEGLPKDYDFGSQWSVYGKLKELIEQYGVTFTHLGATNIKKNPDDINRGKPGYEPEERPSFVVVAGDIDDPVLVWERFIGTKNRESHNFVYVSGQRFGINEFIKMCDLKRAMLFV